MDINTTVPSISKKHVVLILTLAVILLAAGVYYSYMSEKEGIKKGRVNGLKAVASVKINEIQQWNKERWSEAEYFSSGITLIDNVKRLVRGDTAAKPFLNNRFGHIKNTHFYENILITDTSGKILYSLDTSLSGNDNQAAAFIRKAVKSKKIIIKDLYQSTPGKINYDLISPIIDNGTVIAVLILRINPNDYLFGLIEKWPIATRTGETIIFRPQESSIIILNSRFGSGSSRQFIRYNIKEKDLSAIYRQYRKSKVIEGIDYRNAGIIAVIEKVPGTNWFIAVKVNSDEAFEELSEKGKMLAALALVFFMFVLAAVLLFYKYHQSRSYKEMFLKEKILAETKEEYLTTLYSIGDGVITTDTNNVVVKMNHVAENISGWKESEAAGQSLDQIFRIIDEDTSEEVVNLFNRIMYNQETIKLPQNIMLISRCGNRIPISQTISPVKTSSGEIRGAVVVFRDETHQRIKNRVLRESESKFATIFNSSPIGISITREKDGMFLEANEAYFATTGYSKEELIGHTSFEIGFWLEQSHREKLFLELASKKMIQVEMNFRNKTGEVRSGLFSGEMIDMNGERVLLSLLIDITEKRMTEKALWESRQRFKSYFEASIIGIAITSVDRKWIEVNDQVCSLLGYTREELVGSSWEDITYPEDLNINMDIYDEVLTGKVDTYTLEKRYIRKDGEIVNTVVSVKCVKKDDASIDYFVTLIQDVTEFKKAQEHLRFQSNILSQLNDAIITVDNDERVTFWNEAACGLYGYKKEEAIGKTVSDLVRYEWIKPEDKTEFDNSLRENSYWHGENIQYKKNGEKIFVESSYSALKNSRGNIIGILAIITDITKRKQDQQNIKKLSRGIEQSPASIIITGTEGNIEYVNSKFSEITGYRAEEIIGKNLRLLINSAGTVQDDIIWDTILTNGDWSGELLKMKKSGELYWESASISPILDNSGKLTNFISVSQDITDLKKLNEELRKAKEDAEEMNRLKSFFFANMSHELRTPFVGIMGYAEFLSECLKDERERQMAETILTSSKRLMETLNKILSITQLEYNKTEVNITSVNITDVLTELQLLFAKSAEMHNTRIITDFKTDGTLVETDPKLLREILNNLLNNAVKFTFDGTIEISTNYGIKDGKPNFIIRVKDTGIGIPIEKQEIIWQEFRQGSEGLNRSFEGTGLGLSITKKYTNLLGGHVYLESEPGNGSVFTVELPFTPSQKKNEEDKSTASYRLPDSNYSIKNILYVEDDFVSRLFVKKLLSKKYEIDVVENGIDALTAVSGKQYDFLIVDINLGKGIDGIELIKNIRKNPSYNNIPAAAVTAYASQKDKEEFISKGFTHYLAKPFTSSELLELLEKFTA